MSVQIDLITETITIDLITDTISVAVWDGVSIYSNGVLIGNVRAIDFQGSPTISLQGNKILVQYSGSGGGGGTWGSITGTLSNQTDLQGELDAKLNKALTPNVRTLDYALVYADIDKVVIMNMAGANNLTIPPNSSVPFPVGTIIPILRIGAGETTVVAGSGVTITGTSGDLTDPSQNVIFYAYQESVDNWYLENGLPSVNPSWGSIGGTLSNQTDLQAALDVLTAGVNSSLSIGKAIALNTLYPQ